ncbi:MAG: monovalent cation/H+ antiporter subunit D [Polaromonas sp.]|uniref:monovalent cation/H+ antiporter subunit D n=1 Tax=Polaromonas sp. TaxID=1869339 RepID=UPI002732E78A|nr:monovalent cation/H+ antiporter subunit D [Polaromonas sp.]MDP2818371.1 monovalent cation/H+ antiporter subunit D [Polaromonas sp.]
MNWPDLIILPIVLPLMTGALLVLVERKSARLPGWLAAASSLAGLVVALLLLERALTGNVQAYLLGNWAAPFGIALALDRLSALMVLLTSVIACITLLYASGGDAQRGRHFYSLLQFQLMGLNGAFLTADLFNLFVFFEVLLIASYGLLLHGAGAARLRASIHYVSFNLAGSALFLIAASLLYGLTGTLNLADLAQRVPLVTADRTLLVQSAALLLVVVFSVKAALLPLYFWLPATYSAASAPVAALFAIMTKVGVYAILRVTTLIFGETGGPAAFVTSPWLEFLALGTLLLGAVGAVAAKSLRVMIGNVVVASAGTLLLAVALGRPDTVAAGLFYLVNSTLVAAALFLLADRLRASRGWADDDFRSASMSDAGHVAYAGDSPTLLGVLFFTLAVGAAGLPPLAGFLGKAMLLQAAGQTVWAGWIVAVLLTSSLLLMIAFVQSGSVLFWKPVASSADGLATDAIPPASPTDRSSIPALPGHAAHSASLALLLALLVACAVFAGPLSRFTQATSAQLFERQAYIGAVLGASAVPAAIDVRREMRERKKRAIGETKP